MKTVLSALAAAALACLATTATAHDFTHGDLKIDHPYARMVIPSRPAAAFFTVHNKGDADRLVSAASPAYARVELHSHEMKDGVVKMFQVDGVDVPAGGMAELKSGGHHVMLFEPTQKLKIGDSFPLTLHFAKAGMVEVVVKIEPLKNSGGGHEGHDMKGHDMKGHKMEKPDMKGHDMPGHKS